MTYTESEMMSLIQTRLDGARGGPVAFTSDEIECLIEILEEGFEATYKEEIDRHRNTLKEIREWILRTIKEDLDK